MSPSPLVIAIFYCLLFRCLSIYFGMMVSVTGSVVFVFFFFFVCSLKAARAGIIAVVFTISTNLLLL